MKYCHFVTWNNWRFTQEIRSCRKLQCSVWCKCTCKSSEHLDRQCSCK